MRSTKETELSAKRRRVTRPRLTGADSVRLGYSHRLQVHLLPDDVPNSSVSQKEAKSARRDAKQQSPAAVECRLRFVEFDINSSLDTGQPGSSLDEKLLQVDVASGGQTQTEWQTEAIARIELSLYIGDQPVQESQLSVRVVDGRLNLTNIPARQCRTIGKKGDRPGQFRSPRDVLVDPQTAHLVVSDCCNHRIQVVRDDGTHVRFIGNGRGKLDGQFEGPWGVELTSEDILFVSDSSNRRISKFRLQTGDWLASFALEMNPVGVVLGPSRDKLFVASSSHFIDVFSMDGQRLSTIGSGLGEWEGYLKVPYGLAFNSRDELLVGDGCNGRISVFDGKSGEFVQVFGRLGMGGIFLDVDPFDRTIVSVVRDHLLEFFDAGFQSIASFGSRGNRAHDLRQPGGVLFDNSNDRLIVCDSDNNRLSFISLSLQ